MRALIFDMDGVLVDSQLHWRTVGHSFLQQLVPHWDADAQRSILGMSVYDLYRHLAEHHQVSLTREEFIAKYSELTEEIYGTRCKLFPGVHELMQAYQKKQWKIAIASSSPRSWMEVVIRRFELKQYLDDSLSSDDVDARTKPAPDIYLEAARRLQVSAADCVAIEDTAKGIASAKAAGMRCVGFRNGYNDREDFARADFECRDLGSLLLSDLL